MVPDHRDNEPGPPGSGAGSSSGGSLGTRSPGGFLAGLVDAANRAGGLAGLSDDELVGVMRAWQRLRSWSSSGLMASAAELARRRPADRTPPAAPGRFPEQISEFAVDEVAAALTVTGRAADTLFATALDLETRLPVTARALHEGLIDEPRARLIAEATRILTGDQAGQVESLVFPEAAGQTTGQLRAA